MEAEWARRSRFDGQAGRLQQAAAVAAGVVVSAVGLLAPKTGTIPLAATIFLIAALTTLMTSFVLGVVVQLPHKYRATSITTLKHMIGPHWGDGAEVSRNHTADLKIRTIETLRTGNAQKANWVIATQITLGLGVAAGLAAMTVVALTI